jgi:thiamine transporter
MVSKQQRTRALTESAIMIALATILSLLKLYELPWGGSVTLASMLPLLLYAYFYGARDGLLVGVIFGLLNFLSGPWILTPMTFVLDYPLAYASIALMGFAKKFGKNPLLQVILGVLAVYAFRFSCHFFSGVIYFMENSIWVDFPDWALSGPFVYSFIYQCLYLPLDMLITLGAFIPLATTKVLQRMQAILKN